jgi:alpha-ketoglutaric semialdehyde dehydrogenase
MIFKSRIGNNFSEETKNVFSTFNCLKNEKNEEIFCVATVQDAKNAAFLAKKAFREYKNTNAELRGTFLKKIANELETKRGELIEMYCKESSLSISRANTELDRTIFQLNYFSEHILGKDWHRTIVSPLLGTSVKIKTSLHAIGPVAVFGASNFPFAYSTIGGDAASALAVGCPVIVKAHPMHAGTSCLVADIVLNIAEELALPNGVFSHLLDNGHEIGTELVEHEYISAVGFTGSVKGGRALMDIAAKRIAPIPVFAEMGSVNPVILFQSELEKNFELWSDKLTLSISNDAGQFCTKPGLLFVPDSPEGNKFIKELKKQLSLLEPTCHLHPNLFNSFKEQVEEVFDWISCKQAYHSQPTLREITLDEYLNDYKYHEEFFGPQAIAVIYHSQQELEEMLDKLDGQLTTTFIGSKEEFDQYINVVESAKEKVGRIIYNGVPTGVVVSDAMMHGGTYPASSDSRFTAVGLQSIYRFLRPVAIQMMEV